MTTTRFGKMGPEVSMRGWITGPGLCGLVLVATIAGCGTATVVDIDTKVRGQGTFTITLPDGTMTLIEWSDTACGAGFDGASGGPGLVTVSCSALPASPVHIELRMGLGGGGSRTLEAVPWPAAGLPDVGTGEVAVRVTANGVRHESQTVGAMTANVPSWIGKNAGGEMGRIEFSTPTPFALTGNVQAAPLGEIIFDVNAPRSPGGTVLELADPMCVYFLIGPYAGTMAAGNQWTCCPPGEKGDASCLRPPLKMFVNTTEEACMRDIMIDEAALFCWAAECALQRGFDESEAKAMINPMATSDAVSAKNYITSAHMRVADAQQLCGGVTFASGTPECKTVPACPCFTTDCGYPSP